MLAAIKDVNKTLVDMISNLGGKTYLMLQKRSKFLVR